MSEQMAAEIRIGGSINAELASQLCEQIQQAQVSVDWSGEWFQPHAAHDLLTARRDRTGPSLLILSDEQACWGEFHDLERFLRQHAVAYDRLTDGRWEFDPHVAYYRPGGEVLELVTDEQHQPVVRARAFELVVEVLCQMQGMLAVGGVAAAKRALRKAQRLLARALPPEIPPLEPFEIVEV